MLKITVKKDSGKQNNQEITHYSGINTIYLKQLYICIFFTVLLLSTNKGLIGEEKSMPSSVS